MPRVKPPRTVEKGLWEKPTVLNNVETYANVPKIILQGADWFRTIGTEGSPGTKTFSLTLGTSTSSSDDQQSDSQQNAGSSRSAEGGNTLTSATPSI